MLQFREAAEICQDALKVLEKSSKPDTSNSILFLVELAKNHALLGINKEMFMRDFEVELDNYHHAPQVSLKRPRTTLKKPENWIPLTSFILVYITPLIRGRLEQIRPLTNICEPFRTANINEVSSGNATNYGIQWIEPVRRCVFKDVLSVPAD